MNCNSLVYSRLSVDEMARIAKAQGLLSLPDMRAVEDLVLTSSSAIEIGSGYGRVINYLSEFPLQLYAVEMDDAFYTFLCQRFTTYENVFPLHGVFPSLQLPQVDLLLASWSVFMDFSPEQQETLFLHSHSLLNPGGSFVIDLPRDFNQTSLTQIKPGVGYTQIGGIPAYAYLPSESDLINLSSGFSYDTRPYKTDTGKHRVAHIFTL